MQIVIFLPILMGLAMVIFAKSIGLAFCKFGKASWKTATFGKTDMAFFYPEDKAPMIMRLFGGFSVVFGVLFLIGAGFPFRGPGQFKAMNEAKSYLGETYGSSSGNWELSTKKVSEDNVVVIVDYKYGKVSGSLKAEWAGAHYMFSEINHK